MPWITPGEAAAAIARGSGRGVKVAILDSGIELAHPAMAGVELADEVMIVETPKQLATVPGEGRDLYGHGTAVAATVLALAPEATLGSFCVLGASLRSRTAVILEGARQAIERGYHILNCSFGCGYEDHWKHYKKWIDEAYLLGVHVVASCDNTDAARAEWPAFFTSVIAVNMARTDSDRDLFHRPGTLVEFAARGVDVEVPWGGGGTKRMTGSSFAAPRVSGMLACLLSEAPGLTPLQAKLLLQRIARPAPPGALAANDR